MSNIDIALTIVGTGIALYLAVRVFLHLYFKAKKKYQLELIDELENPRTGERTNG